MMVDYLMRVVQSNDLIITMGAGDIWQTVPKLKNCSKNSRRHKLVEVRYLSRIMRQGTHGRHRRGKRSKNLLLPIMAACLLSSKPCV